MTALLAPRTSATRTVVMVPAAEAGDLCTLLWTNEGAPAEIQFAEGTGFSILRVLVDGRIVFYGDSVRANFERSAPAFRRGMQIQKSHPLPKVPMGGQVTVIAKGPNGRGVQLGLVTGGGWSSTGGSTDGRLLEGPIPGTRGYDVGNALMKPIVYGAVLGVPVGALIACGGGIAWSTGKPATWMVRGLKVMGASIAALWTVQAVDKHVMKLPLS